LKKAVSPVVAVLLLILIAVAASIIVYVWTLGYVEPPASNTISGEPLLKIDAVTVLEDENKSEHAYAIRVYVRNIGDGTAHLSNNSLYVIKNGNTVAIGVATIFNGTTIEVKPNSISEITYYLNNIVKSGEYIFKITSSEGVEAPTRVRLPCKMVGKATIHKVTVENNEANKVISEDGYAKYETWYTIEDSSYKIWFRIYAKPGVTIAAARAELFSKNGAYPIWVGGNPWHWTTPFTYPDWAGAEWCPVQPDEMPVTVVYTIYVEES